MYLSHGGISIFLLVTSNISIRGPGFDRWSQAKPDVVTMQSGPFDSMRHAAKPHARSTTVAVRDSFWNPVGSVDIPIRIAS